MHKMHHKLKLLRIMIKYIFDNIERTVRVRSIYSRTAYYLISHI